MRVVIIESAWALTISRIHVSLYRKQLSMTRSYVNFEEEEFREVEECYLCGTGVLGEGGCSLIYRPRVCGLEEGHFQTLNQKSQANSVRYLWGVGRCGYCQAVSGERRASTCSERLTKLVNELMSLNIWADSQGCSAMFADIRG